MSIEVTAIPQSSSPNPASLSADTSSHINTEIKHTRQTQKTSFSERLKLGAAGVGQLALNTIGAVTGMPQVTNALSPIAANVTGGNNDTNTLASSIENSQHQSAIDQLKLIQLQSDIQNENRQISMISNISKAKHDTAKAAITNIRV